MKQSLLLLLIPSVHALFNATRTAEKHFLSPGETNGCVSKCDSFHAGASTKSTLVCMYQASGVGTLTQNVEKGNACFPSYGCREDWNVCIQWQASKDHPTETIPDTNPLSNLGDNTKLRAACEEITSLTAGGSSGQKPPSGGWQPTSLGWNKGTGNIGCGWGSTYVGLICFLTLTQLLLITYVLTFSFSKSIIFFNVIFFIVIFVILLLDNT